MNYNKLRGAIREKYGTQSDFAAALGVDKCTLSAKLNGKTEWTRREIEKACELLGIPLEDVPGYFFSPKS